MCYFTWKLELVSNVLWMIVKITYSAIATYSEFFLMNQKLPKMKSYIFQEIGIPEIHVWLFENFQNLAALQVWCLAFTKSFEWLTNGTIFWQSSPNNSGGKKCKKMYNTKSKSYLMWGICLKASFNHISMV